MARICLICDGGKYRPAGDPNDCVSTGNMEATLGGCPNNSFHAGWGDESLIDKSCCVPEAPSGGGPGAMLPVSGQDMMAWIQSNPIYAALIGLVLLKLLGGRR